MLDKKTIDILLEEAGEHSSKGNHFEYNVIMEIIQKLFKKADEEMAAGLAELGWE